MIRNGCFIHPSGLKQVIASRSLQNPFSIRVYNYHLLDICQISNICRIPNSAKANSFERSSFALDQRGRTSTLDTIGSNAWSVPCLRKCWPFLVFWLFLIHAQLQWWICVNELESVLLLLYLAVVLLWKSSFLFPWIFSRSSLLEWLNNLWGCDSMHHQRPRPMPPCGVSWSETKIRSFALEGPMKIS